MRAALLAILLATGAIASPRPPAWTPQRMIEGMLFPLYPQVLPFPGPGKHRAAAAMSVIAATGVTNTAGSNNINASQTLNIAAHDQLVADVSYQPVTGSCTTPTITLGDGGSNTFSAVGTPVLNAFSASLCNKLMQLNDASANSSATLNLTASNTNTLMLGFKVIQLRGTANVTADTTGSRDGTTGASTAVLPGSGSVTSTTAASIVIGTISYGGSSVTATATASGCFGSTGTIPTNACSSSTTWMCIQYVILSSTNTSTCSFDNSVSVHTIGQVGIYH